MKINWILETNIFKEGIDLLIREIKGQSMTYGTMKYIPFSDLGKQLTIEGESSLDHALYYGSINLARKLMGRNISIFNTFKFYECLNYYPVFGKYLVNRDYVMYPYGDFVRAFNTVIDFFKTDRLFVSPNDGEKTFTGTIIPKSVVYEDSVRIWEDIDRFHQIPHNTLVIASSYKIIDGEWRFVVCDDKVITGSKYKEEGKSIRITETENSPVFKYAQSILDTIEFKADPLWTLDICECNGEYKVMEIGGFSCAGLYACDLRLICESVKSVMEKM